MSAERKYTERDLVLAKRQGVRTALIHETYLSVKQIEGVADYHFPLPKVTRPRVVVDPHNPRVTWSILGTVARHDGTWGFEPAPTLERIKMWADLLANPTEEVEEES